MDALLLPVKEYRTTDLALAGYLRLRGLPVVRVELIPENRRKSRFVFDDRVDLAEHLALEFANGEFQEYDSHVRSLKKLIHK